MGTASGRQVINNDTKMVNLPCIYLPDHVKVVREEGGGREVLLGNVFKQFTKNVVNCMFLKSLIIYFQLMIISIFL